MKDYENSSASSSEDESEGGIQKRSPREVCHPDRKSADEQKQRAKRRRSIIHGLLVFVTLAVGVLMFMLLEKLYFLEALYVTTQIVTTIGYGDITFDHSWMRMFMAFYVLWLLVLVAFFLNSAIQSVIDSHAEDMKSQLREVEAWAEHAQSVVRSTTGLHQDLLPEEFLDINLKETYAALNHLLYSASIFLLHLAFGTVFFANYEGCSCSYGMTEVDGCTRDNVCEVGNVKSYADAFYMSVVTLTTVGFGDLSPSTQIGRMVGIPWMISGIVSTAYFVEGMQNFFFKMETHQRFDDAAQAMSLESFNAIDRDGNGVLSKAEFVNFCLVEHGLVDQETLDRISGIFDAMDRSNDNVVTFEEVQEFQKAYRQ